MAHTYGVEWLDPERHLCPSIGSKPALALFPLAFINPGDITVTTVPGYPVLATYTRYLGGEVVGASPASRKRLPARPGAAHARGAAPGQTPLPQLPQQPHRRRGQPGVFRPTSSTSPAGTGSLWSTTPPTAPWSLTARSP